MNQTCKGSLNTTLACDEKIDALLNRAREVSDVDQRRGLYREAIDLFDARRNIIDIYDPTTSSPSEEPERVQGRARRPDPDQRHVLELIT